ncbi:hypothetical protein GCM10023187_12420 [Nibrella viscosa]|uniref:Uncharacterized protein n=1 Tax=Nibrella viscosa TaxID=1084524 RepID=A0ABP8K3H3_9BACT
MTGKELFLNYLDQNQTPDQRQYAQTLMTARYTVGDERLFAALEEAESKGLVIGLTNPVNEGYYSPDGIKLVPKFSELSLWLTHPARIPT